MSAGALANPEFFGWAANPARPADELEKVIIDRVPLVEFVTEAVRFTHQCIGAHISVAGGEIRATGAQLKDRVPVILNNRQVSSPFPPHLHPATTDSFTAKIVATDDPNRDAGTLLGEIYGEGFGLGESEVPFLDAGAVDVDLNELIQSRLAGRPAFLPRLPPVAEGRTSCGRP